MVFDANSLKLSHNYLSSWMQRVTIIVLTAFGKYIFYLVLQGSILGPLLFSIHFYDLF